MPYNYYGCYELFHNEILDAWKHEDGKKPSSVTIAEYIQATGLHAFDTGDISFAEHCGKCITAVTNLNYCKPVQELVGNMLSVLDSNSKDYNTLANADNVMRNTFA